MVNLNDQCMEVFLQPGELYFGGGQLRMRTLLGSCVSMVFWHPERRLGGMCHYLLPHRAGERGGEMLDGRYADEAVMLIMEHMWHHSTRPAEYHVKVIGGGNMFPGVFTNAMRNIGMQNADAARNLIGTYSFNCVYEHLNGTGHRQVIFDVPSGEVLVRHTALPVDRNLDGERDEYVTH